MKFSSSVGTEGQSQALNTILSQHNPAYGVMFSFFSITLILSFICEYIHQAASSFPIFGFHFLVPNKNPKYLILIYSVVFTILGRGTSYDAHHYIFRIIHLLLLSYIHITQNTRNYNNASTRVGTLIVATIYLQLIQNRYVFRSFTVLQCSHQHCVQPVASDVEVVGYL